MWEEDPRHQQGRFRWTAGVLILGTMSMMFAAWMSGDFAPLRDWLFWLLMLEGAWLGVAGLVYGVVKFRRVWSERRAKNRARVPSSG